MFTLCPDELQGVDRDVDVDLTVDLDECADRHRVMLEGQTPHLRIHTPVLTLFFLFFVSLSCWPIKCSGPSSHALSYHM
jgi:hypothetical protein